MTRDVMFTAKINMYHLVIVSTNIQSLCHRWFGSQNNEVSEQHQDDLHQEWQSQLFLDDPLICCLFYESVYCHSTVAIAERIAIFTKPIRGHHTFSHVEWQG